MENIVWSIVGNMLGKEYLITPFNRDPKTNEKAVSPRNDKEARATLSVPPPSEEGTQSRLPTRGDRNQSHPQVRQARRRA